MAAMNDHARLPGWDSVVDEVGDDVAASPAAPLPATAPGTYGLRILGVSEVARAIREAVRSDPRLADVWVEGEVGRVTVSTAGHAYFTLKDARSAIACVWFSDDRARSAFQAQAGLRIVVHGRIDLFEQQGAVQLYVESIQPAGFGDLAIRFEALKARLSAEGLFDPARKRPLPARPTTIAPSSSSRAPPVWGYGSTMSSTSRSAQSRVALPSGSGDPTWTSRPGFASRPRSPRAPTRSGSPGLLPA